MFRLLIRTQTVLEDCEEFLDSSGLFGSPIESYLVQHALVVLCADIQQEIYKIVSMRASRSSDQGLNSFVSKTSTKVLRSVEKSQLAGFVAQFGDEEKSIFNSLVDDRDATIYNNAVKNRHDVAHKSGVQITFSELKAALKASENIICCFAFSLIPKSDTQKALCGQ